LVVIDTVEMKLQACRSHGVAGGGNDGKATEAAAAASGPGMELGVSAGTLKVTLEEGTVIAALSMAAALKKLLVKQKRPKAAAAAATAGNAGNARGGSFGPGFWELPPKHPAAVTAIEETRGKSEKTKLSLVDVRLLAATVVYTAPLPVLPAFAEPAVSGGDQLPDKGAGSAAPRVTSALEMAVAGMELTVHPGTQLMAIAVQCVKMETSSSDRRAGPSMEEVSAGSLQQWQKARREGWQWVGNVGSGRDASCR
jgi:hypothetical protein